MRLINILLCALLLVTRARAQMAKEINSAIPNPDHWTRIGDAPDDHPVSFKLVLAGEHFGQLEQRMSEIASTRGNWLSSEELEYFVTPSSEAQDAVRMFLDQHETSDVTFTRAMDVVSVHTTARVASEMFSATFSLYEDATESINQVHAKTDRLIVPSSIAQHVVNVEGLNHFAKPRRIYPVQPSRPTTHTPSVPSGHSRVHASPPGCVDTNASWPCIRQFYGVEGYDPAPEWESIAVINYERWSDASILAFEENLVPRANGYIPNKRYLGGDTGTWDNTSLDTWEDTADIETLIAMAYPLDLSTYSTNLTFADNIRALIELPDHVRPGVVSISYGNQEDTLTLEDSIAFCNAVQQLTALGTTFLAASGDDGVAGTPPKPHCPPFGAAFMPACPYVVSVGATMQFSRERAAFNDSLPDKVNGWSTSGFSNRLTPLSYQTTIIRSYLTREGLLDSTNFNTTGRAYNDVSAIGAYVNFWDAEGFAYGWGTSFSSPIFASILALVNSKCKNAGKPRIGWVHPSLYSHPEAFHDITTGGPYMCGNTTLGLPCVAGWDPPTGLGSPSFPALVRAFGCD